MENRIQFKGRMPTRRTTGVARWLLALTVAVTGFAMTGCDDDDNKTPVDNREYTISGEANNSQVVSTDTTGTDTTALAGTGSISGKYNPGTRVLTYTATWTALTGPPTSAGFFNGDAGSAGPAVGAPFTIDAAATVAGTTSGTMTITEEQAKQLLANRWYYQFATAARPGGEVRGQVTAER